MRTMASVTGEKSAGEASSMQVPSGPPQRGTDTPKHTPVLGPVTLVTACKVPLAGWSAESVFSGVPFILVSSSLWGNTGGTGTVSLTPKLPEPHSGNQQEP